MTEAEKFLKLILSMPEDDYIRLKVKDIKFLYNEIRQLSKANSFINEDWMNLWNYVLDLSFSTNEEKIKTAYEKILECMKLYENNTNKKMLEVGGIESVLE